MKELFILGVVGLIAFLLLSAGVNYFYGVNPAAQLLAVILEAI